MELIQVDRLFRKYSLSLEAKRQNGLREIFLNFWGFASKESNLNPNEFWAVKDVSFTLKRGEALGLLGLNGAGKSTLLKMLAGRISPSQGTITLHGSMNAMLELGSGFSPNLSGRENIRLLCSMKGLSLKEIDKVFEEVIDFAEIGKFIDSPVAFYSSGMRARLAFAISIVTRPDILLIDEVLSVGDFRFRQKCLDRINLLRDDCALVLVSHSAATIRMFCNTAIVMDKGQVVFSGAADEAVDKYHSMMDEKSRGTKQNQDIITRGKKDVRGEIFENYEKVKMLNAQWVDEQGNKTDSFYRDENIYLKIELELKCKPRNLFLGVPVWNSSEVFITAFNSDYSRGGANISGLHLTAVLEINPALNPDIYKCALAIHDGPEYLFRTYLPSFEIKGSHARLLGLVTIPHNWNFEPKKEQASEDLACDNFKE